MSLCQALGGATRFKIISLLSNGKMTPGEICAKLDKSSAVISVHLAKLRQLGMVRYKREPGGLYYSLRKRELAELLRVLEDFAHRI